MPDPSEDQRTVFQSPDEQARTAAESAALVPGRTVPGFELIEELSRGGMGIVYKARQVALDRVVALKAINPHALNADGNRELFAREAAATASVSHPNVVTVYHTELDGPFPYLAMEYVNGIDLQRLVRRGGPLPVADAATYARQAAAGLHHAHERGVVHRDVKPANLMVAPSPLADPPPPLRNRVVKVLDLGLARVAATDRAASAADHHPRFVGTPDFASPEQAADARTADARSDVFSLGATLYFLLTGDVPCPGETFAEKLAQARAEPPPSVRVRRPDVPPALDAIVARMLARRPENRYPTAAGVVAALDDFLRSPAFLSHSPTGGPAGHPHAGPRPMPENFFDRERAAVAKLTDAVRARAAAEAELKAAFDAATDRADREVARARKATAAAREAELGRLDSSHAAALAGITEKHETEQLAADRALAEARTTRTAKFTAAEEKGRKEYEDKLWHHDSLLEAGEKAAREQHEALQRKAAAGAERVADVWAAAEPLLGRAGITRAAIEYHGALPDPSDDDAITRMNRAADAAEAASDRLAALKLAPWCGVRGLLACVFVGATLGAASFAALDPTTAAGATVGVALVVGVGLWLAVRSAGKKATLRVGAEVGEALAVAERAVRLLNDFAAQEYATERARIADRHARKRKDTDDHFLPSFASQKKQYDAETERASTQYEAKTAALEAARAAATKAENDGYRATRAAAEVRFERELSQIEAAHAERTAAATVARDTAWQAAATAWERATTQVAAEFAALRAEGQDLFPAWDEVASPDRPLVARVPQGVRCGDWLVDMATVPEGVSADPKLAPPAELSAPVPAFLPFPDRCSVLLRARDEGRAVAVGALQAMMLRFLTGLPPGKVRFTIIDPVGLGDNFAAFMHLADHDEKLVTSQIWTEPVQIEQRLVDLTDHIASVIQKYLRNQYKSIEDYNRAAGEVAEPYRVLVIANFPAGFTPDAAKRLISIVQSGPSCGVCTLVSADTRMAMPRDFNIHDVEAASLTLTWKEGAFVPKDPVLATFPLVLDPPPGTSAVAQIVQRVGKASKAAARVEVPFAYIAPKPGEEWTGDASRSFEVPVGRAGATRKQAFTLGRGTAQHALVAGKTGSGKSTLLHALITNLALTYSPDEAELYLIDFKEGVEFQWYATYRLPHARVVAIQSEREFGLSVLQRLDVILRERGEKFRDSGVNDLAGYRAAHPNEKTPRILLIVDEFQAFFTEDDKVAQEASLLLDRLVRQGRAFGMHVVLGSQTLGGAYSLARSTIDQMAVRVALQCSDADAQLILSKDNSAARLLSRPGEAIYNDQNGLVEGNDPFQVVWLAEEKREAVLAELRDRAGDRWPPPLVFAGNTSADLANNPALSRALSMQAPAKVPLAWLGEPVAIKEPTAAAFRPVGSANLLVIGQNEDAARGLFASAALGLSAQLAVLPSPRTGEGAGASPAGEGYETKDNPSPPIPLPQGERGARFAILDGTPDDAADADYLTQLAGKVPGVFAPPRSGLPAAIAELAIEMDRRHKGESGDRTPRFLLVFGVHRFRELRKAEDDYSFGRRGADREPTPSERFAALLRDGPPVGIHLIVWCDSLTNLNRSFDRPQLREFGMRVLFQMSPTDSSTLMDTPAASRLGRNRALFLVEDQDRPEKFRPYGLPATEWLDTAAKALRSRTGVGLNPEPAAV
ncbi:cell division protein : DNA segregation ATPase, FtsK/SpoIIIE family OS=Singulisphaera acidiphila (strain ATCC BAA-1392 / DSM 18658 / VKM B-2454 / MOB10) GN=Sinac_6281 PE=4 SV=1: Pkinase: FtsK_SpoIIIE [Gemmataceae bacterium]|nr:cell division protein : DNA segregation ATPase, FtsK/SpoIIIE family OS=Singulisphaera acidiphila (strain ATCC BAA-1392 / DSM 18658 / VKM B-2454 / MOB10) GN=Sinac_6281 PE=4 SV=1: Pkinase: FtsK_SpoIIIE [Gemmataceae bacterium]VTT98113.1 cell division protein : DNA segregation ATPase, FtsK/SpoIIIE family OS=Singulisphaera acidiphila (strain ATCC BAA-1392 / DSM 18658 / VKM B-2454 / MOB10) GN=Sinac_6281 PE=4 SV=1: Pkinase: FtsK_SpoIIIE [Gemmataceae bacterium]